MPTNKDDASYPSISNLPADTADKNQAVNDYNNEQFIQSLSLLSPLSSPLDLNILLAHNMDDDKEIWPTYIDEYKS